MWRVGSSHVRRSFHIHTTHILGVVSYSVRGKLAFTLHHRSYIAFIPLLAVGSVLGVCPSPCIALPTVRTYVCVMLVKCFLKALLLMLPLSNLYTRKYLVTDNTYMTFVEECSFKCQKCGLWSSKVPSMLTVYLCVQTYIHTYISTSLHTVYT